MPRTLDPELRKALAERIRFYNELGVYDFYRRDTPASVSSVRLVAELEVEQNQPESGDEMSPRKAAAVAKPVAVEENIFEVMAPKPEQGVSDPAKICREPTYITTAPTIPIRVKTAAITPNSLLPSFLPKSSAPRPDKYPTPTASNFSRNPVYLKIK